MKKLMFAVAAVAAGVAMADVTSANIVGYAGNELNTEYGAVMVAPQFLNVGGEKISLSALVPVSEGGLDWCVEVQGLNAFGETREDRDYMWVGGEWCDVNGTPIVEEVTFDQGEALWVFSYLGETAANLRSSGEVGIKDLDVALSTEYGAVATGNPFPVAIKLNDIVPVAADGVYLDWSVEIQRLNAFGETIEDSDYMWVGGKWCDVNGTPIEEEVVFNPGEGIWAFSYTGESQAYLRITAPEL